MATQNFYMNSDSNNIIWKLDGTKYLGLFGVGRTQYDQESEGAVRVVNVTIPQGLTITSATLHIKIGSKGDNNVKARITGIDENNVSDFNDDPFVKSQTGATTNFDFPVGSTGEFQDFGVTSQVQEIVDRAGWSSGNAMGFQVWNNASDVGHYLNGNGYDTTSYLTIVAPINSASASKSLSPSASQSPSGSFSPSASPSSMPPFSGIKIAKAGKNALTENNPNNYIFHSDYNTLKIISEGSATPTLANNASEQLYSIAHGLSFTPFVFGFCKFTNGKVFPVGGGMSNFTFTRMTVDNTNINFYYYNVTGGNYSPTFKYIASEIPL